MSKMEDETQLKKVRELYSKLVEAQFSFMGKGEFCLQKIYSTVKKKYPNLCDDNFMCDWCCKDGNENDPEWHHRVRTALDSLKKRFKKNVRKGCSRSYWIIGEINV